MKTFLTIILIALIVYYILKYLGRFLLYRMMNKFGADLNENDNMTNKQEGDVSIQNKQKKNNKTRDIGEYVDFEEIDSQ